MRLTWWGCGANVLPWHVAVYEAAVVPLAVTGASSTGRWPVNRLCRPPECVPSRRRACSFGQHWSKACRWGSCVRANRSLSPPIAGPLLRRVNPPQPCRRSAAIPGDPSSHPALPARRGVGTRACRQNLPDHRAVHDIGRVTGASDRTVSCSFASMVSGETSSSTLLQQLHAASPPSCQCRRESARTPPMLQARLPRSA